MSDDDPFDDLEAGEVDADADAEVDADVDELFSEVPVDDVDDEAVWDALTGTDEAAGDTDGDDAPAAEGLASDGEQATEGTVVPKASYCQKCEHFSAPPQSVCGNPGTEIVELVDVDHFRVRDCPVVASRESASRDLGDEE